MYKHILINATSQIGQRDKKIELTGRSPLRRQRSALDCSANKEKEEEGCTVLENFKILIILI